MDHFLYCFPTLSKTNEEYLLIKSLNFFQNAVSSLTRFSSLFISSAKLRQQRKKENYTSVFALSTIPAEEKFKFIILLFKPLFNLLITTAKMHI